MGRGVNAPHSGSDAQDDLEGVPHVSMGGIGRAGVSGAGHPRTETQDDVGHAGSVTANGVHLDRKRERRGSLINWDTTQSRSDVTTS